MHNHSFIYLNCIIIGDYRLEFDYIIIGSGLSGLTFADILLRETKARIAIVDQNSEPGGAWNDAYDHARLEIDPAQYGIPSVRMGEFIRANGPESSTKAPAKVEVLSYFKTLMIEHFLPTKRIHYFPRSKYVGAGRMKAISSNTLTEITACRTIIDATRCGRWTRAPHIPCFTHGDTVSVIPPQDLLASVTGDARPFEQFCVIGAGLVAIDTALELLRLGIGADQIVWIKPREPWLLEQTLTTPLSSLEYANIVSEANDQDVLYRRLEENGNVFRLSPDITPSMHHGVIKSAADLTPLRSIERVVRKGHVHGISPIGIILDDGVESLPERTLYIDCTGAPVLQRALPPIFQDNQIILQPATLGDPGFSAEIIATIELLHRETSAKNALCQPLIRPDRPEDFLEVMQRSFANQHAWASDPALRARLATHPPDHAMAPSELLLHASDNLFGMVRSNLSDLVNRG